jgi:methyl acetate hydrolase
MRGKAQIDQVLRRMCETSEIPGVVAISANSKEVIYQGAHGKRDLSKDDAMTLDSVFWIASMTKAVTAAAAMQLVERGKLSLDAPIGKLLPDLAAPQVLEGFDAKGEPRLARPGSRLRCAISSPTRRASAIPCGMATCSNIWTSPEPRPTEPA